MLTAALHALVVTIIIEVPIVALVFRDQMKRMALVCLLTTGVTNFFMNTVLHGLVPSYDHFVLIGELGAVVIEAAVYAIASKPRDLARALIASALANGASYWFGL